MDDLISRQDALSFLRNWERVKDYSWGERNIIKATINEIESLPSAQPSIKQAAKLLLDFIESCPGGESYLITPDDKELITDWGYAMEGIQLIYDWAKRRNDG